MEVSKLTKLTTKVCYDDEDWWDKTANRFQQNHFLSIYGLSGLMTKLKICENHCKLVALTKKHTKHTKFYNNCKACTLNHRYVLIT